MISTPAYIGPGMGVGTIVIVVLVSLVIVASLAFTIYLTLKRFLSKKRSK